MTEQELKGYESDVANHRAVLPEVMAQVFELARAGLASAETTEASPAPARKSKSKQAD